MQVRYGEPLRFERLTGSSHEAQQVVADEVLDAVRELYASLAAPSHLKDAVSLQHRTVNGERAALAQVADHVPMQR